MSSVSLYLSPNFQTNHILRFGQKRNLAARCEQNDDEWHTNGLVASWCCFRAVLLPSGQRGQLADGRVGLCSCRLRYCAAQADSGLASGCVSQFTREYVSSSYDLKCLAPCKRRPVEFRPRKVRASSELPSLGVLGVMPRADTSR